MIGENFFIGLSFLLLLWQFYRTLRLPLPFNSDQIQLLGEYYREIYSGSLHFDRPFVGFNRRKIATEICGEYDHIFLPAVAFHEPEIGRERI